MPVNNYLLIDSVIYYYHKVIIIGGFYLSKNKMNWAFFLFVLLLVFVLSGASSAITNPEPANSSAVVMDQSAIDGHQMVYQQMVSATEI